uniref:Uncharacterized protein n=1 Tax=Mola mola TaxID=94237 RepID=A0A3Q3X9M1_MOLML
MDLRIPPHMSVYADKHNIFQLLQSLLSGLLIDQPDDPIGHLIRQLRRSRSDVPRVVLLGPPAVGKHTVVSFTGLTDSNVSDIMAVQSHKMPPGRVHAVSSCRVSQGWVLEGIPQTRLQARSLQQAGVLPEHVVMMEAPDDVLLERFQGRLVDPLTGDTYHRTFIWPADDAVAQRLEEESSLSEEQRTADLQRYRCEVTGLTSAYQNVLKVINCDQPHTDVYQQALGFVRTRRQYRTPRILLLGPPGAGKSHQARLLSEKYKLVDVCCGHLLSSAAADGSVLGRQIGLHLDDGSAVPDSLVLQVLEERLSRLDCSCRGWILHGFPRDLEQAQRLQESQHQPNRVLVLELTDDVCVQRIALRATDPVSGDRFHALTHPAPSSEVQNRLKTRPEDSTHTVTHTVSQYRIHTAGLQSVYPDAVHVDADQDPHTVFEALESRLTEGVT